MVLKSRRVLVIVWLGMAMASAVPAMSASTDPNAKASVEYSQNPATVLVSFREIYPEFADQDPTPLVSIYGDGRVVVFYPSYMKQAGRYEMLMAPDELKALLLQLTPVLLSFDTADVKNQKKAADDLLWNSATEWKDQVIFHDADAEISMFYLNIDAYQPGGLQGQRISKPVLNQSWRGLRFDARDYPGLEPIQDLMQAEKTLRALTRRSELVKVESLP